LAIAEFGCWRIVSLWIAIFVEDVVLYYGVSDDSWLKANSQWLKAIS